MSGSRVVVVGDVINDIVVVPRGTIRHAHDTVATIRPLPGGSGANTAAWLGTLGADVDFVGCVGMDDLREHEDVFRDARVVPHLQMDSGVPTGTIVILVDGDTRTMLTERGANRTLVTTAVTEALLAEAGALHISGYSILDGFGVPGARDLIDRATAAGVPVSVTPGSLGYLEAFGATGFLAAIDGARIVFPNLAEGRLLTGLDDPEAIGAALADRFPIVVLTLGAEGLLLFADGETVRVAAPNVPQLLDPTGAGDALAAGFLHAWVRDRDAVAAARAGVYAAAQAVMTIGGRPPV